MLMRRSPLGASRCPIVQTLAGDGDHGIQNGADFYCHETEGSADAVADVWALRRPHAGESALVLVSMHSPNDDVF